MVLFSPVQALQHGHPFARRFLISPAATAGWDFGSGDDSCNVPEPHGFSFLYDGTPEPFPLAHRRQLERIDLERPDILALIRGIN